MSWIKCKCGEIIHDNTDRISYKGYIISDKEYFDMFDLADEMIKSANPDREELTMTFRRNIGSYIKIKKIYQCYTCGRLLLENDQGEICSFVPENSDDKKMLDYESVGKINY